MELVRKGFAFMPRDEDLILHYLRPFCRNEAMVVNIIHEVNVYDFSPKELADRYEKLNSKEWYFFTPREKRYAGGQRPSRITKSNGFWKITGKGKDITVNGEVIGKRNCLVYYKAKGYKTNWIMYEYIYVQQQHINTSTTKLEKALCKIHENPERKKKTSQVVAEEAVHVFLNPLLDSNHEQQQQQRFLNTTLHSNRQQQQQQHQQVDEEEEDVGDEVMKLLDFDEEEPQKQPQEEQEQSFLNPTLHSNQEQNPILDSNQEQHQERNQEAPYILDNGFFHLMQSNTFDAQEPQEIDQILVRPIIAQSLLNPTLDSNQQQGYIQDNMHSNTYNNTQQQVPDFFDVRQQEQQWQQQEEEETLYMQQPQQIAQTLLRPNFAQPLLNPTLHTNQEQDQQQQLQWQQEAEFMFYMQHQRVLREIEQDQEHLKALLSDPLSHPSYFNF